MPSRGPRIERNDLTRDTGRWQSARAVNRSLHFGIGRSKTPRRTDIELVRQLRRTYADVPMSVADACLVRLAEQLGQCAVLTLDDDFTAYRRHGRQVIPRVSPSGDFTS
jgi:hypothetical protein